MATGQGWLLVKDGYWSRVAAGQGWLLVKGGYWSRMAAGQGWVPFIFIKSERRCLHNRFMAERDW